MLITDGRNERIDERVTMETPMEIFKSEDGKVQVNVRIEDDTAWLTQAAMADLFGCGSDNVVKHLKNIYEEGELQEKATTEFFSVVRNEGGRQVSRQLKHYNLDAIIAVGYRVNSARATQFRIWATKVLKGASAMRSPRKPPRFGWRSSRVVCAKRSVARALRNLNVTCGIWRMTTMTDKEVNDGNKNH